MSERLLVATRKGLFELRGAGPRLEITGRWFLGEPVTAVLRDPRDGAIYAALDLGHFGAKLHRSDDDGATWREVAVPSYAGVRGFGDPADPPPALSMIWTLEADPVATAGGGLWAGVIPGGLFGSVDRGETWTLNRGLWDQPMRAEWFGGGFDQPGVHSITFDPRDGRTTPQPIASDAWLRAKVSQNVTVRLRGPV